MSTMMRATAVAAGPRRRLAGLGALLGRWWVARMERLAMRQLQGMSDRELKDIGVVRSEIEFAVRAVRERARFLRYL